MVFPPFRQVMTTSRAGGLHKPPWGIPHAEPIGSSNNPPLAVVALPPQMWQLFLSLPCVNGRKFASKLARLAVTEGLFYYVLPRVQSLSRFATAPFTQGSLRCGGNCAKLKLFGTTSIAGGFRYTNKIPERGIVRARGILYYMMRFLQYVLHFMLANA